VKRASLLNLGLSLGTSALLVVVLEGGARLIEKSRPPSGEVADYIWDWDAKMPSGFYVMKSDAVGWPPWEEINADGLRDRMRPHEKPEGVRRVVVLGDSVTLGAQIRRDQAFPQLLEAQLAAAGRPIEVMNVSLWGWSTRQERIAWDRIARRYQPDAAILAVCLNDIPELYNNLERPPRWLTAQHEHSAVARLIVNARGREIDSVERLFTDSEASRVREALDRFFGEVRLLRQQVEKDGASFAVVVFPFRFQVEAGAPDPSVQRRIAAFCGAERLACLDLLPVLAPLGRSAFVDYDHLSPAGAAATAEAVWGSGLLPSSEAAPELLRPALGTGEGGRIVAAWLASEGQPLPSEGARSLASALSAADVPTRLAAAWALARAGASAAPAREALSAALRRDSSTGVRAAAAAAFGAMGAAARPAVPELFAALGDPSEAVRHAVALALSRLPLGPEDVARLLSALDSGDDYVSAFAAWTLGNMGDRARAAVPALARALTRERTNAVVSGALARIGPAAAQAVPVLLEALRSPDADRRWRAARTLGRIGPAAEAAVEPLAQALTDENGAVRQHAARALGRIGAAARPAAGALQRATADPDKSVRREALAALERLR
jgi:HEAT repeat protein